MQRKRIACPVTEDQRRYIETLIRNYGEWIYRIIHIRIFRCSYKDLIISAAENIRVIDYSVCHPVYHRGKRIVKKAYPHLLVLPDIGLLQQLKFVVRYLDPFGRKAVNDLKIAV